MLTRINGERDLVPLSSAVLRNPFDGGSEERLNILGRSRAAHGASDLLRCQPGRDQRIALELPAELAGIKPPCVLKHGSQEILDDELVRVSPLELVGEEAGACDRRVHRLEREDAGDQRREGSAYEHRP